MTNNSILITGTSTGIGKACALLLAQKGFNVFACVRKETDGEALIKEATGRLTPIYLDVSESEAIKKAVKTVSKATGGELFGLVNNAGICLATPVELTPIDELRQSLEVNIIGAIAMTKAFLPLLKKGKGRIVNMGSVFGLCSIPCRGSYAASKSAMEAFTDCMRLEFKPYGITVSIIEPGGIQTEIWRKDDEQRDKIYSDCDPGTYKLYKPLIASVNRRIHSTPFLPAEAVAKKVSHIFRSKKPKARYIVGMDTRIMHFVERFPTVIRDIIIRNVFCPKY